jgi:hypothetical protein
MWGLRGIVLMVLLGVSFGAGCAGNGGLSMVRASPCPGGQWVSARRGPTGAWQPGHWRCPQPVAQQEQ